MVTQPQRYRIIGPYGPVPGSIGLAYPVNVECTRLNDEANPDPERLRVVVYRIERVK